VINSKYSIVINYLDSKRVSYKVLSGKNDLDLTCNYLLCSKKNKLDLISYLKKNKYRFVTSIITKINGQEIMYFLHNDSQDELIIDLHVKNKKNYINALKNYFQIFKLTTNIYFMEYSDILKFKNKFKKSSLPIKYPHYLNYFQIAYYSMRGCIVVVNSFKTLKPFKL
jgi:hypothetical protein